MSDAPIAVLLEDGRLLTGEDFEPVDGRDGELRCIRPDVLLRATITSEVAHGGMVHQLSVRNVGFGRIRIARLSPLWMTGPLIAGGGEAEGLAGVALWLQGRHTHSAVYSHRFGRGEQHADLPSYSIRDSDEGRTFLSMWMTVSGEAQNDQQTLLGFITTGRQLSDIRLTTDRDERQPLQLDCGCELDGWLLGPGESVSSEKLLVLGPGPAIELAERYALANAREMDAQVREHVLTGWCSWYFFYNRVSEADVLANLDALVAEGRPVEVVQIDDGFQSATGDWLVPNAKFPSGMAALAGRIDEAGFVPGLWLSPFVMHRDSRVLAEHPEWALRNGNGETIRISMWLGEVTVLDCTHPGAQEWLRDVVRTVTRDWGYRYLKLDALAFACQSRAQYYAPNTTAAANLRIGLQIIREAAGDETFILGCTCPFGPAVGLVDAMRTGPDVAETWFNALEASVRHALRFALPRSYMHRRLWLNDPDCLVVRENNSTLSEDEARFCAAGIALSGGLVILSDDLASLSPSRLSIAQSVLPPLGIEARPLDLLERGTPALWALPIQKGEDAWQVLGVFNWDNEPCDYDIDLQKLGLLGPVHVFEYWSQRYEGRFSDSLPIKQLASHSCRVFSLRPARDRLQLLSMSGHLTHGGVQLESVTFPDDRTLLLRFAEIWTRPVRAWLHLPPGCTRLDLHPQGLTLTFETDLLAVELDPAIAQEWTLRAF
ncbi:MAG: glycoside hydrolase family 36 protein [Dehalococcoidia bacterium]